MTHLRRRHLMHAGIALGATLIGLPVRACEFYAGTLRITHPWARATPQSAAFATVHLRLDEVTRADRLLAVETPMAASASLFESNEATPWPLDIPAGRDTVFAAGARELRLLQLTQDLEIGRSYPLRLVFEQGGAVNALLNIDYGRFS